MDLTSRGILKNWLPRLPAIVRTALLASLGRSENAEHQEWTTEVLVQSVRPILQTPAALLASQEFFKWDPGVWGSMWVAESSVPAPRRQNLPPSGSAAITINQALQFAFEVLSDHEDELTADFSPQLSSRVTFEWTCYRSKARQWSRPPAHLSPKQIYQEALRDLPDGENAPVILFAHGGAFCLMDPANHRFEVAKLAQLTESRVVNVRYRLAPQNPFPAALMDMFLTYLALLAPPPGSFHEPVAASKIVLAGDSSGSNLVTALQVLLTTLSQHGRRSIQNPWLSDESCVIHLADPPTAGLSLASPWLDVTRSLPSQRENQRYDFIAPMPSLTDDLLSTSPLFPADSIWPSNPPRAETYCEAPVCAHPLVTPLMAPSAILKDFPPTYLHAGWEGMTDEAEVFARKVWLAKHEEAGRLRAKSQIQLRHHDSETMKDSGYVSSDDANREQVRLDLLSPVSPALDVKTHQVLDVRGQDVRGKQDIVFEGYTAQPHTFSFLPFNRAGTKAMHNRANHIRSALGLPQLHATVVEPATNSPSGCATWTNSKTMCETSVPLGELGLELGKDAQCGYDRKQPLTDELVRDLVNAGRDFRVRLERKLQDDSSEAKNRQKGSRPQVQQDEPGIEKLFVLTMLSISSGMFALIVELVLYLLWTFIFSGRDFTFSFFNGALWHLMQQDIQL